MDVLGRTIVELKLSPTTTDESLANLEGFQDVQTLSLANTQVARLKRFENHRRPVASFG